MDMGHKLTYFDLNHPNKSLLLNTRVLGKIGGLNLVHYFKRRKQTRLIGSRILALRKTIPMIPSDTDQVTNFHVDLVVLSGLCGSTASRLCAFCPP